MQRPDDPVANLLGIAGLAASTLVLAILVMSSAAAILSGKTISGAAGVVVFGMCASWCTTTLWRWLRG